MGNVALADRSGVASATPLLAADVRAALTPLLALVGDAGVRPPPTLRELRDLHLVLARDRASYREGDPDRLEPTTLATYEAAWRRFEEMGALDRPATEETAKAILRELPKGSRNAFGGALSAAYHLGGVGEAMASRRWWRYKPPRTELDLGDYLEAAKACGAGLDRALHRCRRGPRSCEVTVAVAALLVCYTGARPRELAKALQADLVHDGKGSRLRLVAKGGERWIPLAPALVELLRLLPNRGPYLFPGRDARTKRPIGACSISHAMGRFGAPSPQRVRRLYASWLIDQLVPISVVAALMGHTSPQTLLRYYVRPSAARILETAAMVAEALAGQASFPWMRQGQAGGSDEKESEQLPPARMQRMRIKRAHNNNPLGSGRHRGGPAKIGGGRS